MSREDFSSTGTGMGAPGARCSWQKADKHIYAEHQKTELLQPVSELLFLHCILQFILHVRAALHADAAEEIKGLDMSTMYPRQRVPTESITVCMTVCKGRFCVMVIAIGTECPVLHKYKLIAWIPYR